MGNLNTTVKMANMQICIIAVLVSVVLGNHNSSELVKFERQDAFISFRYQSDRFAPFSIGIGRRAPFYIDGQFILERLSASQLHRFEVNAWHSETRHYTMIRLKINEVHRTDGGTYTCKFGIPKRLQKKALTVNFPPGRADCRVNQINGSVWEILKCSATGGSPRGRIVCFDSKYEEIPPRGGVGQNGTHILQEIPINQNASVYCCTVHQASLMKHECTDFVLRRENHDDINDKIALSNAQVTTGKTYFTSFQMFMPTTATKTRSNHGNPWIYICTAALALGFIMVTFIVLGVLRRQRLRGNDEASKNRPAEIKPITSSSNDDINKKINVDCPSECSRNKEFDSESNDISPEAKKHDKDGQGVDGMITAPTKLLPTTDENDDD